MRAFQNTLLLGRWVQTRVPRPLRWSSGLDFSWLAVRTYHAMSRDLPMREIKRRPSWVDFLSPLSDEELDALQGRATFVRLQKGEVMVVGAKEHGEWMLIVVAGQLQVFETSLRSERELTLAVLGSGSKVNGTGVVARWTRELSLRALEPSVVCRLAQQDLQDLMRRNPEVGIRLAREMATWSMLMEDRWADMVEKEVSERLAGLIYMLGELHGVVSKDGPMNPTRYTNWQLASMIGSNREAVTRAFSELQ
jgi:CRP/FNR family transcriptional regulator, cyclic AMP receptor protein